MPNKRRWLDQKDFDAMRRELESFEQMREQVIGASREIIKLSKLTIYAAQRGDVKGADVQAKLLSAAFRRLPKDLYDVGIQKVAVQEYVEAIAFVHFLKSKSLPTRASLGVESEDYLMGLCDLTGELVRKAVQDVTHGNAQGAVDAHEFLDALYGELLRFNPRNGELRKKIDSIKWNLKKLDEIRYDLRMRGQVRME